MRSSAFAFTRWSTTRTSWQEDAEISGDKDFVAGVLNAVNIV